MYQRLQVATHLVIVPIPNFVNLCLHWKQNIKVLTTTRTQEVKSTYCNASIFAKQLLEIAEGHLNRFSTIKHNQTPKENGTECQETAEKHRRLCSVEYFAGCQLLRKAKAAWEFSENLNFDINLSFTDASCVPSAPLFLHDCSQNLIWPRGSCLSVWRPHHKRLASCLFLFI